MSEYRRVSRADKHTKRRKNQRTLLFFIGLAALFFIILFSLIASGGKDKKDDVVIEDEEAEEISLQDETEQNAENNDETTNEEQSNYETNIEEVDRNENIDDVVIQQIESTDENVIEAYSGNWPPIGTVQQGPHTTNYSEGSDDRIEIKRAVSLVTGIEESNLTEHWIGNGGEQKVIATVSDKETDENYHVYLSWIDETGWQVTMVERIKQIQKKS